ncbi:unnamed protein product [Bursaphelenchus xylophilus]|uniref:(pine wood nematode) hypothetical protein n=1 Tax=Bursaphelenchus xylophilus TaxID=6326 RepID=A0A7I8XQ83_BURXY|nr:unnamed protein product [Bursaphelenchus xylophilus]CAG9122005.1 unnamed protein product [Bursaphelenchus xylophilus]
MALIMRDMVIMVLNTMEIIMVWSMKAMAIMVLNIMALSIMETITDTVMVLNIMASNMDIMDSNTMAWTITENIMDLNMTDMNITDLNMDVMDLIITDLNMEIIMVLNMVTTDSNMVIMALNMASDIMEIISKPITLKIHNAGVQFGFAFD